MLTLSQTWLQEMTVPTCNETKALTFRKVWCHVTYWEEWNVKLPFLVTYLSNWQTN